ncbi:MAG: biopolymer transporter ExbB, partial [Rhodobacteraceae bacterium]|nr:biopolymer transporter ExbB [Paracoccaceae bacterium]
TALEENLTGLTRAVERLTAKLEADTREHSTTARALAQLADGQERLILALQGEDGEGGAHVDAESRMRLRSIDVQLLRILEEISAGRQETMAELRTNLSSLTGYLARRRGSDGPSES